MDDGTEATSSKIPNKIITDNIASAKYSEENAALSREKGIPFKDLISENSDTNLNHRSSIVYPVPSTKIDILF